MKKLFFLIICFFCIIHSPLLAQECVLCGDWIGSRQGQQLNSSGEYDYGIFKDYVRIREYGDEYVIKMKTTFPDHNSVLYETREYTILDADEYSIYFKLAEPLYTEDHGYHQVIGYYRITYRNGYINYSLVNQITVHYDNNRKLIREENTLKYVCCRELGSSNNMNLYKEDDDW